jgi:glycosyltransferase involved in cell wall biosynthesis
LAEKNFDPNLRTILWIYHVEIPGLENYLTFIPHDLLVYDCVDNYAAFPDKSLFYSATVGRNQIIKQEEKLTREADVVFATTPGLVEKLEKYNKNVHFAPNVGDYQRFKDVQELKDQIPEDLVQIPRPRIGFIGALDDYKFDAELVRKAALDHPNYSFVLIGQFALKERDAGLESLGLANLPNVYYLGSRPYEEKKYYLAGLDMEIIPYQLNDYTVGGCFPVKFHDALAAGLPTVVTDLPAYAPFKEVTYIAKSADEFSKKIELALKEDGAERIEERQAVAKENDWDGKVGNMLDWINKKLPTA